jgi:hypothetical protein
MEALVLVMKSIRLIALGGSLLAPVTLYAADTSVAAAETTTTGTVAMSGGSVAAGVGFSWGGGTLTYQGREHPFKVKGLRVGDVGVTDIQAAGTVSHLNSLQDFSGNYTALQAGLTLAGGGSVTAMRNQNGVVITITSTTQGLDVNVGASGVNIALE